VLNARGGKGLDGYSHQVVTAGVPLAAAAVAGTDRYFALRVVLLLIVEAMAVGCCSCCGSGSCMTGNSNLDLHAGRGQLE
jgi:hypothetical protein